MQRHVAIHYFKFEFPQKPLCGTNHHLQRFGLEAEISETNFKTSLSSISLFHKTDKRGLVGHVDEKKKKRSCSASKVRSSSGWERAGQPGGVLMLRLNQEVVGQTRCALTPPRSRRKSKHAGDGEAGKSTWRKTSAALFMYHLRAVYEVR